MNPFQRIQFQKILGAIVHTELVEKPKDDAVIMAFEFAPERLPAELGVFPLNLKRAMDAVREIVVPEAGKPEKTEIFTDGMRVEFKFTGDHAEEARDAWPSVESAIQNLKSQHLRN